jgi:hypothetical protein
MVAARKHVCLKPLPYGRGSETHLPETAPSWSRLGNTLAPKPLPYGRGPETCILLNVLPFPSRDHKGAVCQILESARHRKGTATGVVGQVGNLCGGCQPPQSHSRVPSGRLPIRRSLASCPTSVELPHIAKAAPRLPSWPLSAELDHVCLPTWPTPAELRDVCDAALQLPNWTTSRARQGDRM